MFCARAHSTIYDVEGLEFEGVFISIAPGFFSEICVRTVRVDLQYGKWFVQWFFYGFAVQQREDA